jgi:hypothetical protein
MAYIFQTIANKAAKANITSNNTADAREWFRNAAQQVSTVSAPRLMSDKKNLSPSLVIRDIGKMFMFFYDAKHKATLPYYDQFPLIFPIDFKEGGFMGINLHYLSPVLRATLMNALYTTINNDKYDESTKLKINYQILAGASRFKYFEPCIKRYLWDHVQSQFLNVEVNNWDTALMLPTERFKGASKSRVFADSAQAIGR